MKLTSKGRFAVMSLVDIAINSVGNKPVSLSEISNRQNISLPFLEQIFISLKKSGIVKSVRGPSGGYIFAKNPDFIKIYDVIKAIDEDLKIMRCNGVDYGCIPNKRKTKCLTHNLWNKLSNHILFFLSSVSINDVRKNSYESILNIEHGDNRFDEGDYLR
ncbi:MAG: hypothetical protein CMP38_00085 [Rickettsiales bacterium]|nr:hypothetical protein [Rickettsiales bacterium]|tara:strand:+ start:2221 stop:2700 length:480 start_codon:yes stop_codon:yes gene_type:complete